MCQRQLLFSHKLWCGTFYRIRRSKFSVAMNNNGEIVYVGQNEESFYNSFIRVDEQLNPRLCYSQRKANITLIWPSLEISMIKVTSLVVVWRHWKQNNIPMKKVKKSAIRSLSFGATVLSLLMVFSPDSRQQKGNMCIHKLRQFLRGIALWAMHSRNSVRSFKLL